VSKEDLFLQTLVGEGLEFRTATARCEESCVDGM
jgi:hypothetical protein